MFNPDNIFDAEGLTQLTEQIEGRRQLRNKIENETRISIKLKDFEAEQRALEIERDLEYARIDQARAVDIRRALQQAEIEEERAKSSISITNARMRTEQESERVRIAKDHAIEAARISGANEVRALEIERRKQTDLAEMDSRTALEARRIHTRAEVEAERIENDEQIRGSEIRSRQAISLLETAALAEVSQSRLEKDRAVEESRIEADRAVALRALERDKQVRVTEESVAAEQDRAAILKRYLVEVERLKKDEELIQMEIAKTQKVKLAEADAFSQTEDATIAANRRIDEARIAARRFIDRFEIEQQREIEIVDKERLIAVINKSIEEAHAKGEAALAQKALAAAEEKIKIFLSLSYSGNAWQSEAANIVKALAATPPYDKLVELREVISGTDVQAQISAYESMIANGAQGIISFPVSPTGLNRTIHRGCAKGVLFFMYDATVTEPCAYNVSYITAGFGENTAQALVNMLHGKGKIFLSRGVPGNSVDKRHTDGAMSVFKRYPGIQVVDEYYGMWDDQTTQSETAKALAAHPDVDGIWAQAGEDGAVKALLASGRQKLIPMTGENSNGFRLALANPEYQKRGLQGVSSGSPPATAGYAFKLMMEGLTHKRKLDVHEIQYPLPWVPADAVKICTTDKFENGCNTFPQGKVPDSFVTEVFEPKLLPESSLTAALNGTPTPGATIQPLPAEVTAAPDEPGINCQHCKAPANLYHLTKVQPTVQP